MSQGLCRVARTQPGSLSTPCCQTTRPLSPMLKHGKQDGRVHECTDFILKTAALERQPDRRASLHHNGTGGGRVFAGWIWRGLALLSSP